MDPLFTFTFPRPFEDRCYNLPFNTQHSDDELQDIAYAITRNQFDPANFPNIIIAESGVPYCRTIMDANGEEGRLMKVLMIDVKHWENESTSHIFQGIDDLADHIQGQYVNGIPEIRFLKHKNVFHSNHDEKDTAFTTHLTLYNSWAVTLVSHSTVKHNAEGAL